MGWTSYWPKYIFSRGTAVSRTADAAAPPAAGGGAEAARAGAAPAAETPDELRDAPPPSIAARISCLLIRPPAPVPGICERSTLFSRAMRRTSGELRIFWPLGRRGGAGVADGPAARGALGAGDEAGFGGASVLGGAEACAGASVFAGAGAEAEAAAGAPADAPAPSASITATTVLIGTVWPSLTLISLSTPADGDGISASTLSVEISKSGSSRSILSPGFFSHFVMVPSKMLSPICGMMTSAMALSVVNSSVRSSGQSSSQNVQIDFFPNIRQLVFCQVARGSGNFFRVGQKALLKRRRIRHRRIERGDARDGPIQILESAFADKRRDFSGDAARARVFVNDQELVGLFHRREDRVAIERQKRAQVNHFGVDSLFRQHFGGFHGRMHHRRVAQDGEVLTFAPHRRFANRNRVFLRRNFFLDAAIEIFVLEEEHGIIVAHRGFQEPLRVVGGRGINNLQSRRVHEIHFRIRGMERAAVHAAARGSSQYHRHGRAPAIVALGGEVRHLIEAAGDEIDELHFDDGPQPEIAHAAGCADDGRLADGRIDHAFGTKARQQSFGYLKCPAVDSDIFAERDDGRIAVHLLENGLADSFEHGDGGH